MPDHLRFVCWGASGHAKVLAELISDQGGRVIALFDAVVKESFLSDVEVYPGLEGFRQWASGYGSFHALNGAVAIGRSGTDRLSILEFFRDAGIKTPALIHPSAVIAKTSSLGLGTQVLALSLIAPDVVIGRGCIVNHRVNIDHECHLGDGVHVAPAATLCGCVRVGKNVFIGAGAVILPRIQIGDNAVIGAGSVVTRDVHAGTTVMGNPARVRQVAC
jgi:sugar O-acyltransferase (sialic acid O-acetyltransferase NeuD family)